MNYVPKISVAIVVYNAEPFIENCISSVLNQSYQNFEIIISDDNSNDRTKEIIKSFKDKRIKLIENEKRNFISGNRNIAMKAVKGEYVFFTDADCVVNRYWLEEGLRTLQMEGVIGVRGHTIYEHAFPTIADRVTIFDKMSNHYATCNIAYIRKHLEAIGNFDPLLKYGREDTDVAMKLLKIGKITYSGDMIVLHRKRPWKFSRNIGYSDLYSDSEVLFLKRYPEYQTGIKLGKLRIINPLVWCCIFFPLLLLLYFRISRPHHLILLPLRWFKFVTQKYVLIRASIREKVLIF
ncbi:MAG: Glycosyl transferase, group 2 family protein [Candidatus Gottesmanbacteria bacterium GW2011_GWC2_39_8]|uniref:Glycosyl transferase, group 2 family protein n=1 Tax=Candidatus Gottesmanbacteria bacterium GW2011_GWC2_39_8 TaxID=1618450 RepID=A0A0G0T609_9BACT|nr:MAG: Glycosyl transferase, group 2 family protein [Candidatus Gottesmanbacteria bacterium GW2011_GWC2_39_8]